MVCDLLKRRTLCRPGVAVIPVSLMGHVVHDRQDREVPLANGERMAKEAAGRLVVTEGLGHRRILRVPEVAAEAVRFLGPQQNLRAGLAQRERGDGLEA